MKYNTRLTALALSGTMLLTVNLTLAQTAVLQTSSAVTSVGTVSEFGPETILVRSETSPEPIRYSYTKTTTYVDETGAPVSMDMVKSGLPVTVYYTRDGDRMLASKVIVRRIAAPTSAVVERRTVVEPAPIIEKRTTTTTTTEKK
jgi:hypothetical protein